MSTNPITNEKELLLKVAEGDRQAYALLVSHYAPRLHYYLQPLVNNNLQDTEDILQEVFLSLWTKKERLPLIRSLDQYLFRMAKNRFLDLLRKENSRQQFAEQYKLRSGESSSPYEHTLYAQYSAEAARAIGKLSEKLRVVFLLSTQEDLSIDEIATALALPRETVKKRLYLATRQVRADLKAQTGGDFNFFSLLLPLLC